MILIPVNTIVQLQLYFLKLQATITTTATATPAAAATIPTVITTNMTAECHIQKHLPLTVFFFSSIHQTSIFPLKSFHRLFQILLLFKDDAHVVVSLTCFFRSQNPTRKKNQGRLFLDWFTWCKRKKWPKHILPKWWWKMVMNPTVESIKHHQLNKSTSSKTTNSGCEWPPIKKRRLTSKLASSFPPQPKTSGKKTIPRKNRCKETKICNFRSLGS